MEAKSVEILRSDSHFLMNQVQWDPSGRFVATAVVQKMHDDSASAFKFQQEASFNIWTFQGRPLYRWKKEKLWGVKWRPHSESSINAEEKKKILSELKQREKQIEEEEDKIKGVSKQTIQREIMVKRDAFFAALEKVDKDFARRA